MIILGKVSNSVMLAVKYFWAEVSLTWNSNLTFRLSGTEERGMKWTGIPHALHFIKHFYNDGILSFQVLFHWDSFLIVWVPLNTCEHPFSLGNHTHFKPLLRDLGNAIKNRTLELEKSSVIASESWPNTQHPPPLSFVFDLIIISIFSFWSSSFFT